MIELTRGDGESYGSRQLVRYKPTISKMLYFFNICIALLNVNT